MVATAIAAVARLTAAVRGKESRIGVFASRSARRRSRHLGVSVRQAVWLKTRLPRRAAAWPATALGPSPYPRAPLKAGWDPHSSHRNSWLELTPPTAQMSPKRTWGRRKATPGAALFTYQRFVSSR